MSWQRGFWLLVALGGLVLVGWRTDPLAAVGVWIVFVAVMAGRDAK